MKLVLPLSISGVLISNLCLLIFCRSSPPSVQTHCVGSEAQREFLGALQKQSLTEETPEWLQSWVSRAVGIAAFNRNKEIKMKLEGERKRKEGEKGSQCHICLHAKLLSKLQRVSESVQTEEEGSDMCLWFYPRSFWFVVCTDMLFFILSCFSSLLSPCCCLHLIHSKILITSRIHNHSKIFNRNIKYLHVKDCQTEWITCVTLLKIVHLERAWIVLGNKILWS